MASPIFNESGYMTLISAADTSDGWSITDIDTEIKVEGTGAHYDAIRDGGSLTFSFGTAQDMSALNTHVRIWFQHTFAANLALKASGGLQLFVTSGGNTNYYYVSGSDTHKGSWELLQADLSAPDVDGGASLTAVDAFGITLVHATAARNVDNTYWDISWYGIGIEFYGGTSSDPVTWSTLAYADTGASSSKQYGIVEQIRGGAYYLNHALFIGDSAGTGDTYFNGADETIVFYSANEKSGAYKIEATGNATGSTEIDLSSASILSAATPFILDMSSVNLTSLIMGGCSISNASSSYFKTGQTINDAKFTDCTTIYPDGAEFDGCTFNDSLVSIATLNDLIGCTFNSSGTGHGVDLDVVSTTQTMSWNCEDTGYTASSSGNETILVSVASGQTLTINVADGASTPSVYNTGAGTVEVVAGQVTFQFSLNPIPSSYEWRIYTVNNRGSLAGASEIAGEETATSGTHSYSYTHTADQAIAVQILSYDYVEAIEYYTLGNSDQSSTITLEVDNND